MTCTLPLYVVLFGMTDIFWAVDIGIFLHRPSALSPSLSPILYFLVPTGLAWAC